MTGKTAALAAPLALAMGLLLGCQTTPTATTTATAFTAQPEDASSIRAATPLDWASRSSACSDARKRARAAAKDQCTLSQISVAADSCECRRGDSRASSWRCTAEATYKCAEG